jgi:hypothetical protein
VFASVASILTWPCLLEIPGPGCIQLLSNKEYGPCEMLALA